MQVHIKKPKLVTFSVIQQAALLLTENKATHSNNKRQFEIPI
jgi:hypothetical protein